MLIYNTMVGYKELLFYIMKVISKKEYAIMNAVISKKETIISYTIAILFILAMVTAGVLLNDPEVILPEIARWQLLYGRIVSQDG